MACLRCELMRAKLMILGMRGLGMKATEMPEHLNAKLSVAYFVVALKSGKKQNRIVYRTSPVKGQPAIEVSAWLESEPSLNEAV